MKRENKKWNMITKAYLGSLVIHMLFLGLAFPVTSTTRVLQEGALKINIQSIMEEPSIPKKKMLVSFDNTAFEGFLEKRESREMERANFTNPSNKKEEGFSDLKENEKTILSQYLRKLRMSIEKNKEYPVTARRSGHTGSVLVAFRLFQNGTISDINIRKSSGVESLDVAALNAVQYLQNIEPIPEEVGKNFLDLVLPVHFQLERTSRKDI